MAVFVWNQDLKCLVDKATGEPSVRDPNWVPEAPVVVSDIKEFVSPIDGSLISSRSQLRAHEIRHNVRQVGDDMKGRAVADAKKKKAELERAASEAPSGWLE